MKQDPIALELLRQLNVFNVREAMAPVLARVEHALSVPPDHPQAWEAVPLTSIGFPAPIDVRSCWVFVLRAGATFGPERHPNSHQRTVAFSGEALFEVLIGEAWSPWPLKPTVDQEHATPAISIPPSVWHRISVGPQNFVSVSFHTVPAQELIEETPVGDDLSITTQRLYHA